MLLDYIARYYKFLWFALAGVGFLKIILAYSFNGELQGINGVLYALFKWYDQEEQENEDYEPRRTIMRAHNIITLFIYGLLLLILITTILLYMLGK